MPLPAPLSTRAHTHACTPLARCQCDTRVAPDENGTRVGALAHLASVPLELRLVSLIFLSGRDSESIKPLHLYHKKFGFWSRAFNKEHILA